MNALFYAFIFWICAVPLAILLKRNNTLARGVAAVAIILGSIFSFYSGATSLVLNQIFDFQMQWSIPWSSFHIGLDQLSAWFLLTISALVILTTIYGFSYDTHEKEHFSHGFSWAMFSLLIASMAMVVVAKDGVLFFMAWETMAIASFFLVIREYDRSNVQKAGVIYLIATHIGTIFILVFFILEASSAGSFDFNRWTMNSVNIQHASILFMLALIGFGTKAGFVPLHIWLPEAHPAAPSYVSAIMSGVMIKTGIYGILRSLNWFHSIPHWWGIAVLFIGIISGIIGVLFAITQHDLKRLLAYHSVENIGIITIGIGAGILGLSLGIPALAFFGFTGALLHVLNHSIFKGLLFLGAGSVLHSTHERELDKMGGLLKRMPFTGISFLVGAMAISGLPPLNGFISELTIFISGGYAMMSNNITIALCGACLVGGLALISGLAAACFAKAFGIVFVGEPRSINCSNAKESPSLMILPMIVLSLLCLLIGLGGAPIISFMPPIIKSISPGIMSDFAPYHVQLKNILKFIGLIGVGLIILTVLFIVIKNRLLKKRIVSASVTWDCGYAAPTARMQYTASSFAQPFIHLFKPILRTDVKVQMPNSYFPKRASFYSETPDIFHLEFYVPLFKKIHENLSKFKLLQHGYIQIYILYIALTLLILFIWKLG